MSLEYELQKFPREIKLKDGSKSRLRPLRKDDEKAFHEFFLAVPEPERMFIKHRVTDPAIIRELVAGVGGPINILAVAGAPPVAELERLGVARVSVGSGPMRASLALVREIALELKTRGTYASFAANAVPYDELNDLMR